MEPRELNEMEEIRVLDDGIPIQESAGPEFLCCLAQFIPFRD